MKKISFAVLASVLVLMCGCRTQIVTVNMVPADATVIANGVEYRNKSPLFIEANSARQLLLTVYKEGYREQIHVIDYQLSSVGKVETCMGFLILPLFGLFCDNAWQLKENNVDFVLTPISDEAKKEAAANGVYTGDFSGHIVKNPNPADVTADPKAKEIFSEL